MSTRGLGHLAGFGKKKYYKGGVEAIKKEERGSCIDEDGTRFVVKIKNKKRR
ncbi:hypothetical protein KAI92_01690 [Candidatus Parcubacteria bacterium]|nr:hypothetical protein [Candidatus Parcubacteria bacterium]